jgi:tRNA threonylcarbamoyladenosine biosynthesis protein TsaB
MRLLALDSAVARCSATLVADDQVIAAAQQDQERDHAAVLPVMAQGCLQAAKLRVADLDAIAVTVGPGGFTGIRAGLAFALGLGTAAGKPVIGVTVGEALAESLPALGSRMLWCVTISRRGHIFLEVPVFLEAPGSVESFALADLPVPDQPVAIAGPAASDVASRLAARGADVMLTDARLPAGRHIAAVARRRLLGAIPPRQAQPLYVDPPAARPQPDRSG